MNKSIGLTILFSIPLWAACSQSTADQSHTVGGPCEGCEAVFEFGNKKLSAVDTLPDFHESGERIHIYGTIFQRDGKTPAPNVILYIYHTDQTGHYSAKANATGWAKRHGYIRGWIKTGADGRYSFYTLRPASYPDHTIPQHIHPTVKEPDKNEYYIDEYLFDDDPLLTQAERQRQEQRGGSGIVHLTKEPGKIRSARRDIILGKNIPNY